MDIPRETLLTMYERMCLIREFETKLHEEFAAGKIPGFVHLYAGEEAVAVGVCTHLRDEDYIASTHRGHGHCIAKGVDVNEMMAEIYGKATGACKGKGGSMHIADVSKGMLGANGIVGAGPPLACGAALTAKVKGTDQVSVCFFGDGASNQGTTAEAFNLASIWNLPVIFVAENNGYAETTATSYSMGGRDIADKAHAFGMPGVVVDGSDVFAVYEAVQEAIRRARAGDGPTLIEAKTYRYYGHFEGDQITYRSREEEQEHRNRDCLVRFRKAVSERGLLADSDLDAVEAAAKARLAEAVEFAAKSPMPDLAEVFTDVYVEYPVESRFYKGVM
jgi:acetoin:2,6-dichlorophenolindophenol oxidoreductase subunit alpha